MKKIYSIPLLLFLLINCTSKDYKADLIGDWYHNEQPEIGITFSQDTLYFKENPKSQHKWKVDKKNINLKNLTNLKIDSLIKLGYNYSFFYSLSNNKDTLWIRTKTETPNRSSKLIRVKNHFNHFQKIINLKIDLKENRHDLLKLNRNNYFNVNLYIGFKNDKLVIKTDQTLISKEDSIIPIPPYSKDNLLNAVLTKIESVAEKEVNSLKFNLLIDKEVSEFQIDSIKKILRKTPIKKIFIVYKNDTIDYKNNLNWYGKYE